MKRQRTCPTLTIRLIAMNYSCKHLTLAGALECDGVIKEQSLRRTA